MGEAAILVMWPGTFVQAFVPHPKETPDKIWVESISEKKIFENIDRWWPAGQWTDGETMDVRGIGELVSPLWARRVPGAFYSVRTLECVWGYPLCIVPGVSPCGRKWI